MPNPSTTQVVESREQIALADDAGGVNRDRMWALELFWDEVEKSVGHRSQLEANQTSSVRQNLPIAASDPVYCGATTRHRAGWPVRYA